MASPRCLQAPFHTILRSSGWILCKVVPRRTAAYPLLSAQWDVAERRSFFAFDSSCISSASYSMLHATWVLWMQGGFGSNFNTSAIECSIACQTASGCNAFSYNPFLQQCFLKANPSSDLCQVGRPSSPRVFMPPCNIIQRWHPWLDAQ